MYIFLVTLFLTSTGVVEGERILIGPNNSYNRLVCQKFKHEREITYHTPKNKDYLGSVHLCLKEEMS